MIPKKTSSFTLVAAIAAALTSAGETSAATVFVNAAANGVNNGTSWIDAFTRLQDGLAGANSGDQIFVAEGTYQPDLGATEIPGDRFASFALKSGVEVYGGFIGFEATLAQRAGSFEATILTGDLNGDDLTVGNADNSKVIVLSSSATGAVLDGFTVTAANGDGISDFGGGLRFSGGDAVIRRCRIVNNRVGGDGAGASATSGAGAAFVECDFIDNQAGDVGGGLWSSSSPLTLVNCSFIGNVSGRLGGGVYYFGSTTGVRPITGCLFSGNTAADRGGAMFVSVSSSSPRLAGCTMSGNSATIGDGGISATTGTSMEGCVVWGNSDPSGTGESAQVGGTPGTFNYNCVQGLSGGLGGVGNIGSDPLFVDADGLDNMVGTADDDLTLSVGSPCVDAGTNGAYPNDDYDLDDDGTTAELLPLDIAGQPRFVDDPTVVDTGFGLPPVVDMGAREGTSTPTVFSYGQGCPGSGGFIPTLSITSPVSGQPVTLMVANGLGGGQAVLLLGLGQASLPIGGGCFLNVSPVLPAQIFFPLGGTGAGNGTATFFAPLPGGTSGFTFTLQVFVAEPSLPKPFANSQGLQFTIQ